MSGGLGSAGIHSHRNVPLDVFRGSSYLFIKIIIIMMTDLIFVKKFCDHSFLGEENMLIDAYFAIFANSQQQRCIKS